MVSGKFSFAAEIQTFFPGKWRNYTQFFVENRNDYVNQIASQTNNLIIRLDKLINRQLLGDDVNKKGNLTISVTVHEIVFRFREKHCSVV